MRILLDLQGAQSQSRRRGIGRYTREVTKAFLRRAGGHEVHVALNSALDGDASDQLIAELRDYLPRGRIHYLRLPYGTAESIPGSDWLRRATARLMRHALAALDADVVWHSSVFEGGSEDAAMPDVPLRGSATACTLYDLIPLHDEAAFLPTRAAREWYATRLGYLKQSHLLLAISEWARRDAIDRLGLSGSRVVTVGAAVDGRFKPPVHEDGSAGITLARMGISRPFVFYSGGLDPRKNVPALVAAFAALPPTLRNTHQLVIAGKGEAEQKQLRTAARDRGLCTDDLVLPGYVSEAELVLLYGKCSLFAFPSTLEGFGLPPLEAMACGAPVIAGDAASLPEVMGRSDTLFDPARPGELGALMARILSDPGYAGELRAYGLRRAAGYTWDAVAERTLDAFGELERRCAAPRTGAATPAGDPNPGDDPTSRLVADIASLDGRPTRDDLAQVAYGMSTIRPAPVGRWLVDVSAIARRDLGTGVQQVVRNVLRQWLGQAPAGADIEPVAFRDGQYRYARQFRREILGLPSAHDSGDGVAHAGPGDTFVGLDWTPEALPAARARLEDWRRGGARACFVVYDLLPLTLPSSFHPHSRQVAERWLRDVVHLSDRIACISRTTADELARWMDGAAGVSHQFGRRPSLAHFTLGTDGSAGAERRPIRPALQAALAMRPTLLMVGTLEPRKAHQEGLVLCERLWRSGVDANLVIVGKRGWLVDDLIRRIERHPERGARLFWHEDVGAGELQSLYASSTALLALSHAEGFGLPLVEAARHGLPVFARDIPVFREIAGDYPSFLGPDPEAWPAALARWLAEPARPAPAPRWPTWQDSAAQLAELIRTI